MGGWWGGDVVAYLFDDAATEYLEVEQAAVTATPFSFGCWFWTNDLAANQVMMFVGDKDQSQQYYQILVRGSAGGDPVQLWRRATSTTATSTTTGVTINTWHHAMAVLIADDDAAVYIDGGSVGTSVVSRVPAGWDRMAIGREGDAGPSNYMSGGVAEAVFYNVALSATEVAALALHVSPVMIRPQNIVAYWPLIRGLQDLVGGYDVTAFNAPTVSPHVPIAYPVPQRGYWLAAAPVGGIQVLRRRLMGY